MPDIRIFPGSGYQVFQGADNTKVVRATIDSNGSLELKRFLATTAEEFLKVSGFSNPNILVVTDAGSGAVNITGALGVSGNTTLNTLTVSGNLTVLGDTFNANVETLLIKDNILEINNGEVGYGVTAGTSGIRVNRGSAEEFDFIFRESDRRFVVGTVGTGTTNLLLWSEQFDNAYWTKTRASITANATLAPDGTMTADKLVEDSSASNDHFVTRNFTGTAINHTASLFAKASERTQMLFRVFNGTTYVTSILFNLSNGTAGSGGVITNVGNGWFRCSIVGLLTTASNCNVRIYTAFNNTESYTGDGVSGIFIWGAQLQTGDQATDYVKSEGTQGTSTTSYQVVATRMDDSAMTSAGVSFFNSALNRLDTAANFTFNGTNLILPNQASATTHAVRADRSLTMTGTANQVILSTGAQDLTANRT
jgi:hypothetical protein